MADIGTRTRYLTSVLLRIVQAANDSADTNSARHGQFQVKERRGEKF